MTLGNKLAKLRKENNITQEQLADILGVSRQAISKWESDSAYPETEKLIRLGELYNCSLDYLLKNEPEKEPQTSAVPEQKKHISLKDFYYESKSKRTVMGMPLWHINIGLGRTAKGVFAVGLKAKGIVSLGFLSLGVISMGILSLGAFSFGTIALGLIAAGALSAGIIAFGAICIGILAVGAIATGEFALGALANGHYLAIGARANAMIAVGDEAYGELLAFSGELSEVDSGKIIQLLRENVPFAYQWIVSIVDKFI